MPSPRVTHARKLNPQGTGTSSLSTSVRWTPDQISRLLSIARQAEGQIGSLPAASWWPAFLLTVLDTALAPRVLLSVAMEDYRQQRLTVGLFTYELHPHAVAAIENLSHRSRLFPWPWSVATLTSRLKQLVQLGGLPSAPYPFQILRDAARTELNLLDRLDLSTDYAPLKLPFPDLDPAEAAEKLEPEDTLVGYAQRYPNLRLELKETTAYLYVTVARMFERYYKRPIYLDELSTALLMGWLKAFVADGRSPATGNSHRTTILTLWRMAHEKGHAPPPPKKYDLPKFRVHWKSPISWRPEQVQRILEVCEEHLSGWLPSWPGILKRDYWFSLILFLYESGARIGAALAIAPADVDLENRIVTLRSLTSKTLVEQPIRISQIATDAIRKVLDPDRAVVWPSGKCKHHLYDRLNELQQLAGLSTDRKSKFHRMRRTNATQTALHGSLDMARQQLGHTDVKMTLRAYIDTSVVKPVQAVDVLPSVAPRLSKGAVQQ